MRGKFAFVLGAAVGYVLGSRAGRERYEQIKRGAQRLWATEPVQQGVGFVKDAVDERTDDLKAFAIRVGNDVFSNLAGSREKADPFSTTDEAGAGKAGAGSASKSRASASGAKKPAAKSKKSSSSGGKAKS